MKIPVAPAVAMLALGFALPVSGSDEPFGSPRAAIEPGTVSGESGDAVGDAQKTYGNTMTAYPVSSWGFTPLGDGQWSHFTTGWSNRSGGTNNATCTNIHLPDGAFLLSMNTYTNDTDPALDITYTLRRISLFSATSTLVFNFTTSGAPGVQNLNQSVGVQISNGQNAHVLCIQHASATSSNQSAGATLYYRLQVSPAPAVATFTDVPVGSSQHRFVEALVAAGITGGCGPGLYCPNDPVTRGQMAVFLAVALGLTFF